MIQRQLKLRLTKAQEQILNQWLWHLTGVWNWVIRKIELDAKDKIYHSNYFLNTLLQGSSKRLSLPAQTLQATASNAHLAWQRCFKRVAKKPKYKNRHRKLNSIPFPLTLNLTSKNRIRLPIAGSLKFYNQDLPNGKIKCARIIKRSSGWYLCLFIDTMSKSIKCLSTTAIGIDPGFKDLLTLSNGNKIAGLD